MGERGKVTTFTPVKTLEIMENLLKTTETRTSDNYPYGRLKCTATFGLEFNKKNGFRTVFQTINPKNGRVNAPKKSTYSPIIVMREENGFYDYVHYDLNGKDSMKRTLPFLAENFDLFTKEQMDFIYSQLFLYIFADMKAMVVYCGSKLEDLKPLYEPAINKAKEGMKNPELNLFAEINSILDFDKINTYKVEGYNPFTVKVSSIC